MADPEFTSRLALPQEEWRWVVGYEGAYEVSNLGRVRSYRGGRRVWPVIIRRGFTPSHPYPLVTLWKKARGWTVGVHRLVLLAFVGPCPAGYQGAHLNGKGRDCRLENLAWVTPRENSHHKYAHGTMLRGEQQTNAKLTEEQVREIRRLYAAGGTHKGLAKQFGVSYGLIGHITSRRAWKHVE